MPRRKGRILDQCGTVIIVTAASLAMILGMAGLTLDLGYLFVIKTELQRAADAGAIAGARALFFPKSGPAPQCAAAQSKAWEIAQANYVGGAAPAVSTLPGYGIPYGHWNWTARAYTPGCSASAAAYTNAVGLRASKSNISLTFMGVFGHGPVTLAADALAVMDFVGKLAQGAAFVIVLQKNYVKTAPAETQINLTPTTPDAGAWYAKTPDDPTTHLMQDYLNNPQNVPAIQVNDYVQLNNSGWSAPLNIIRNKYLNQTVLLPVVDSLRFGGESVPVIGFTAFQVTEVQSTSHRYIKGLALQMYEIPASKSEPGGTGDYGLLTAPRLALP
jgi:hypothetical protein